jgi:hypothetical protein
MLELLLPRLRREIEARLAELRPLVAEAERLEVAKAALLAEAAAAERAARRLPRAALRELDLGTRRNGVTGASPVAASAPAADEDTNGRASRGANQDAILAIVEERPGVSVAEISSVTKIAKPTVATTVSKLKREGVLASEAGGVKLASRQPVTLAQVAASVPEREDGVSDEEWEAARRDAAA